MKIKKKLQIAAIVSIILILTSGTAFFISTRRVTRVLEKSRIINQLFEDISERRFFVSEYLFYKTERAQEQSRLKHELIVKNLAETTLFDDKEERDIVSQIRKENKSIEPILTRLLTRISDQELETELASQFIIRHQALTYEVLKLKERTDKEVLTISRQAGVIFGSVILAFVLLIFIVGRILRNVVVGQLMKLQKGTEVVALGDLDYKVKVNTDDEIGQLADSFNTMTAKLKVSYTDLKKNAYEMLVAKTRDEALLVSIGDGMVAVNPDGMVMRMNKVAEQILGWKIEEFIGKKFFDVVPMEDDEGNLILPKDQPIKATTTTTTTTNDGAYYFVKKDKTRVPVAVTVSSAIVEGKTVGAVIIFRDITEEIKFYQTQKEFISIASHQLRTPLSALYWLTESLQESFKDQTLTSKQKQYLDDTISSVARAVKLTEDLLNVSRIQLGTIKVEKVLVDLAAFIEDFISSDIEQYAEIKKHPIIFNKDDRSEPLAQEVDPKILRSVLQNLVSNAIDYSPVDTTVTITLGKEDGLAKISVSNKGPAITKEEQARLFTKFFRGESSKKMKTEGTGLGLFIVKSFVESMGGKVGFESDEGRDTVFWFTIPCKGKS